MKVKELIELLQGFDQELDCTITDGDHVGTRLLKGGNIMIVDFEDKATVNFEADDF